MSRASNPPGSVVKQVKLPSELGTEPGSSGGTACALNHWATSPVHIAALLMHIYMYAWIGETKPVFEKQILPSVVA